MSDPDWSLAEDDPRAFFGLAADATLTDLKRAYARLIKTWKPDKFPSEFKKIRRAFEELEHEFKLKAPPPDLDASHFLRAPDVGTPAEPSVPRTDTPTYERLRPDFPESPGLDWTGRLHELGLEATLAEMEKLCRFEPRDWLLLAALREAQNNDDATAFARTLIEALRHHADSPELWQALLIELQRSWKDAALEGLALELTTLHHHPDFLLRCHGFWMYAFEKAPATHLIPLLDRFLHRAHDKAHQAEASFVLEILVRFAPALPIDWIRVQVGFYEQTWGPNLQGFVADIECLPAILADLETKPDGAAASLREFFAAWGRHDLDGLHLQRFRLRRLLIERPSTAQTLLARPELFLPASRLTSFRSRNLGGEIPPAGELLELPMPISNFQSDLTHCLAILLYPVIGLTLWIMSYTCLSKDTFPIWLVICGFIGLMTVPMIWDRLKSTWNKNSLFDHLITGSACVVSLLLIAGLHAFAIIVLVTLTLNLEVFRDWWQRRLPSLKFFGALIASICVVTASAPLLRDITHQPPSFNCLNHLLLALLTSGFALNAGGIYHGSHLQICRLVDRLLLNRIKRRILQSLSHYRSGILPWLERLTDNQKKRLQNQLQDGDVHLAAAIWEAPRNRGED